MKAILRSINNFSCKLKQSNNLKYNISPKISNNKLKSVSGNGSLVIEDALSKSTKNYKIYGNTYQNSTRGINISPTDINSWVSGQYSTSGVTQPMPSRIRLKELLPVEPNTTYYFNTFDTTNINITHTFIIRECDINETFIKSVGTVNNQTTITTGSNTYYLMVAIGSSATSTGEDFTNYETYFSEGALKPFICLNGAESKEFEPYTNGASPNSDYPQEIMSCGDRTKNLFDKNNANIINGYIQANTGKIISGNSDYIAYIKCKPYTKYSFQRMQIRDNKGRFRIGTTQTIPVADMTVENFYYDYSSEYTATKLDGYVTNANAKYLLFYFSQISGMSQNEIDTILSSIQIEENPIATEYETYYNGYKIPVNVRSDNLFDISEITSVTNGTLSNNIITTNTSGNVAYFNVAPISPQKKLLSGHTYYLSADIRIKSGTGIFRKMNDYVADWVQIQAPIISNEFQRYIYSKTYNGDTDYYRFLFQFGNTNNAVFEIKNIMLSEVNEDYQPYYDETANIYLDEPLRKIDEYSDEIDFKNQKVIRNINEIVLDGTQTMYRVATSTTGIYRFQVSGVVENPTSSSTEIGKILCSHYKKRSAASTYLKNEGISFRNPGVYGLYIYDESRNDYTLEEYKDWLSQNNVTVDYVLKTSTEEDIELPNIKLIEGKNIITIGTEVQGVFEAEYYSKEIIDISDYKYNLRKVED